MTPLEQQLSADNEELTQRLREMEETFRAIHSGDVDALVVNTDVFVLESASASGHRLRQDVLSQMQDAVLAFDLQGHLIFVNAAAERTYRFFSNEMLGRPVSSLYTELPDPGAAEPEALEDDSASRSRVNAIHRLPGGESLAVEVSVSPLVDAAGLPFGSLAVVRDVTQRRRATARREALTQLSETLRDLDVVAEVAFKTSEILARTLGASRVGFGTVDLQAETLRVEQDWTAPGIESLTGTLRLRDYGSFIDALKLGLVVNIPDVYRDPRTADHTDAMDARAVRSLVNVPVFEHGRLVAFLFVNDTVVRRWTDDDVQFIQEVAERTRTATERVRNAAALRDSEARLRDANEGLEAAVQARTAELLTAQEALRQAQKMEAVGQLTGGIAHDFNNLLGGMSASLQVLQSRLQQGKLDSAGRYITMSQEAIKRAAALTQRLLAFARRQTLDPKPVDVNRLVTNLEELIRRSTGPGVTLEVVGAGGLWTTKIDPSQLENSLLNLCINARDAMAPHGGRLTVETSNKWLDDRTAAERDMAPGQYVVLSVTDTGAGMTPEVIERIFDPFFTTKPIGQGTGLGLSMVYGFVRQSGGQVRVYSEVGKGTTMSLYLPRHVGEADAAELDPGATFLETGDGERVLVIEDETTIRELIAEVLQEAGYDVVTAEDGPSGLRILQAPGRIDMLVTDVGLPGGLNGRQVADAARVFRTDLKVLFITGYAENAAVGNGLLAHGMQVLTKPFDIFTLANKVREMSSSTG